MSGLRHTREASARYTPLTVFAVLLLATSWTPQLYARLEEAYRAPPWIEADLTLLPPALPGGAPRVEYEARVIAPYRGTWVAYVLGEDGARGSGSKGAGYYDPALQERRVWTWEAFFERDVRVPTKPFQVCVSYEGTLRSGARGAFGPYCSPLFDPTGDTE